MFFNTAFVSSLLLATQVLAAPSGFSLQPLTLSSDVVTTTAPPNYEPTWAGAFMDGSNGSFTSVSGTFTVPTLPNPNNGSVAAWVGIDGINCPGVLFHAGISCGSQLPPCGAWYEWSATNNSQNFYNVSVSAGDVVKVTVNASSETSGTARIDNESTGEWEVAGLVFPTPICGRTAEWIVEDFTINGKLLPLADFGNITFTNAWANNSFGSWGPGVASILDIQQDGVTLTNVSFTDTSVTILYTG